MSSIPLAVQQALWGLLVASLTYLTLRIQQIGATVRRHNEALRGSPASATQIAPLPLVDAPARGASLTRAGGGGASPIPADSIPLWSQLHDPNPDGRPDPWSTTDCGWESVCIVARMCRGVVVGEGDARAQLGGAGTIGISSARQLEALLRHWEFSPSVTTPDAAHAGLDVRTALGSGYPVIALGEWVTPGVLHWVVIVGATASSFSYEDPWYGRLEHVDSGEWAQLYRGVLIDAGEATRPR